MPSLPPPLRPPLEAGIRAAAEVLFPVNELGAPDYRDAAIVQRMLAYIDELPPDVGRMVAMLFVAVELGGGLLAGRARRFSALSLAERNASIRRWYRANDPVRASLVDALKGSLTMIYLSHPDVVAHMKSVKACSRPWDHFEIAVDAEAFVERHAPREEEVPR